MIQVAVGVVVDLVIGDRCIGTHPVVIIGKLIEKLENILYGEFNQKQRGLILTLSTLLIVGVVVMGIEKLIHLHWFIKWTLGLYLMYLIPSAKSLKDYTEALIPSLENNNLTHARQQLGMLVGRDTESLTKEEMIRASIETSSENTIDGLVAPVFYMAIGSFFGHGLLLGYLYKAINTLDSMVGYQNEKYQHFGYFSAKLDDWVNFVPARLGSLMMIFIGQLLGFDGHHAWTVFLRDRYNHKSPNSGHPESVTAGLMGIQLGGNSFYFGQMVEKPRIGDSNRIPTVLDIRKSNQILYGVAYLWVALLVITGVWL
jgi:adenosylcobinamide-phosphate synthase